MSWLLSRSIAPGVPAGSRGVPGTSLVSGGRTEVELTSVRHPVLSRVRVVTVALNPSQTRYPTPSQRADFYERTVAALQAIPGVEATAAPTPSATASAPTRPTCLPQPMTDPFARVSTLTTKLTLGTCGWARNRVFPYNLQQFASKCT